MGYRHKRINAELARKYFSEQYGYAVEQVWIRKPLAWAAYHLWRFLDTHEPERPQDPKVIRMVAGSSVKHDTDSDFRPIAQGEFLARFEDLVRRTPMIATPDVQKLRQLVYDAVEATTTLYERSSVTCPMPSDLHTHDYEEVEVVKGVTVQVLRCKTCGHESTGWYRE